MNESTPITRYPFVIALALAVLVPDGVYLVLTYVPFHYLSAEFGDGYWGEIVASRYWFYAATSALAVAMLGYIGLRLRPLPVRAIDRVFGWSYLLVAVAEAKELWIGSRWTADSFEVGDYFVGVESWLLPVVSVSLYLLLALSFLRQQRRLPVFFAIHLAYSIAISVVWYVLTPSPEELAHENPWNFLQPEDRVEMTGPTSGIIYDVDPETGEENAFPFDTAPSTIQIAGDSLGWAYMAVLAAYVFDWRRRAANGLAGQQLSRE